MSRPPINQQVSFERGAHPAAQPRRNEQPYYPQQGSQRPPAIPSKDGTKYSEPNVPTLGYAEAGYADASGARLHPGFSDAAGTDVRRKKSMVRPERERIDPGHRHYYYREHANDENVRVQPSVTGNRPYAAGQNGNSGLRRGKSVLGREGDQPNDESGLNLFKRSATLRRKASRSVPRPAQSGAPPEPPHKSGCCANIAPGPVDCWMIYCFVMTCWIPNFIISGVFGKKTPEAQRAWREKMGICFIVGCLMGIVGFVTFGFTQTVCKAPGLRINGGHVLNDSLIVNGYVYELSTWKHPATAGGVFNGSNSPLYEEPWMAGGKDASFLFQNINQKCLGVFTPGSSSNIQTQNIGGQIGMAYYFPCNLFEQNSTLPANKTGYDTAYQCHATQAARDAWDGEKRAIGKAKHSGIVYYSWPQVNSQSNNLAVYKGSVLNLNLLQWLQREQVKYPAVFDAMASGNTTFRGRDITALMSRTAEFTKYGDCLTDTIRVGFVDSKTIGCVASDVVLYLSLVFILGAVLIKFVMALFFGWFLSWRLGNFENQSYGERMKRADEIENWTDDIYSAAPGYLRPNARDNNFKPKKTGFLPTQSRFSKVDTYVVGTSRPPTTYEAARRQGQASSIYGGGNKFNARDTPPGSPMIHGSTTSLPFRGGDDASLFNQQQQQQSNCPFPLTNVIAQPPPDFQPFGYPLVHTLCLVTAYSESIEGLRTTLDSIATTDYPNSHKLILVVCDGMVKGQGSKEHTPNIVLGMMKDLVVPKEQVSPHSYVAIADGHKRHNKAKVYAGYYDYDNETVEPSKQQRVPMVLVAKVGNELEQNDAKPGNRGKRDSQIVIMSFLQKVMFDERMTTFEYEFFNSLWRCSGVSPDKYETILCVDADTKVFPDSLSRLNACMVNDTEIMGLCGETKIANKRETWVTMIQVFEYYISHHQTKAFESVFGGVTCLPGCFSIYRIKAPKGDQGYWVPILANPDIVEHYSENIVDTLHKKNLLLLGEDRYLSTLMLKTFPKRKMVFCPQAVCKTIVPDTFSVLLSQRRRWINSTIHNLFELMLVRDLCGTFCFSMQFVVFMDLVGTLVLPAAITFTLYVIIIAIIPKSVTGMQKPIVSLILLAMILGLPGVLIVVTSRKVVYVGWMLIYLCSLPVWNLILPAYSFWHMDDFSWGQTRMVEGETKEGGGHGDKEGAFDATHIVMKKWIEFERERRLREGIRSRDSYSDIVHRSNSPKIGTNYRNSMISTSETYNSGINASGSGYNLAPDTYGGQRGLAAGSGSSDESAQTRPNQSPDGSRSVNAAGYDSEDHPMLGGSSSPDAYRSQGVSLVDPGYSIPAAQDPVRRVARHQRRSSKGGSGVRSPTGASNAQLPPGARY